MGKKENDARFVKTGLKIEQALGELLQKKRFDEISVRDIKTTAQISRSAFYLHFEDKYDLVKQYQLKLMAEGMQILEGMVDKSRRKVALALLTFLNTKGKLIAQILAQNDSSDIQLQIKNLLFQNAKKNIIQHTTLSDDLTVDLDIKAAYLSSAVFGVTRHWMASGQKETPEQVVAIMDQIFLVDFK